MKRLLQVFLVLFALLFESGYVLFAQKTTDTIYLQSVEIKGFRDGSAQNGYKVDSSSTGVLGKLPLINIPFSSHVISEDYIENNAIQTFADAIKANPTVAVSLVPNNDERGLIELFVRGFVPGYFYDGIRVNSYHVPLISNVERLEVLNGLNSSFYGFSQLGGSVNFVPKKPVSNNMLDVKTGIYNGYVKYAAADAGGRILKSDILTFRLNAYHEGGETYIKDQHQNKSMVSGAIKLKLLKNTEFLVDFNHREDHLTGQQNVFVINPLANIDVPSASLFDFNKLYGQPWTFVDLSYTHAGVSFETKITKTISVRSAYRYTDAYWDYNYVLATLSDNDGNFTVKDIEFNPQDRHYDSGYGIIDFTPTTGPLKHNISLGYYGYNDLIHFGVNVTTNLGSSNLNNNSYVNAPDTIYSINHEYSSYNRYYQNNFFLIDRIEIGEKILFTGGVSQSYYKTIRTTGNLTQTGSANYVQDKLLPMFTLLYKPIKHLSVYGAYSQGLSIGGTAPATAVNANEVLDPRVQQQYELGAKAEIKDLFISVAAFNIDVKNEYLDPADTVYKQDGQEVHQGIEFSATGNITRDFTIGGGITVMNVEVQKADNKPSIVGKVPQNVPENYGSLYLEYRLPFVKGLAINVRGNYCGKRPIDAENLAFIPSSNTFDAGIRYAFYSGKQRIQLTGSVSNFTNEKYFSAYTSTGLRLGTPRLVSVSLRFTI